jgi:hypothetical protein
LPFLIHDSQRTVSDPRPWIMLHSKPTEQECIHSRDKSSGPSNQQSSLVLQNHLPKQHMCSD